MGYHKTIINKGTVGEFSKISEEYLELKDAVEQDCKILILNELCDLVGSVEMYVEQKFNMTLKDIIQMKDLTKSSFVEGSRK